MSDGIEIHFDERRGYLELACEPDAFAPYRELAKSQLTDFPEIDTRKVIEINVVDTAAIVARREEPRSQVLSFVVAAGIILACGLAVVGLFTIVYLIVTNT